MRAALALAVGAGLLQAPQNSNLRLLWVVQSRQASVGTAATPTHAAGMLQGCDQRSHAVQSSVKQKCAKQGFMRMIGAHLGSPGVVWVPEDCVGMADGVLGLLEGLAQGQGLGWGCPYCWGGMALWVTAQ